MSHEIRTPLNAVVGVTEMLRQTQLNPNQREMLAMVTQSSNNLMLLINNILDFAKLEAGNLALNKQTFDLIDCVSAALDSVRSAAQEKLLQLNYRIEPSHPHRAGGRSGAAAADPGQLAGKRHQIYRIRQRRNSR
jgi:signal transduction histidine kinase